MVIHLGVSVVLLGGVIIFELGFCFLPQHDHCLSGRLVDIILHVIFPFNVVLELCEEIMLDIVPELIILLYWVCYWVNIIGIHSICWWVLTLSESIILDLVDEEISIIDIKEIEQ